MPRLLVATHAACVAAGAGGLALVQHGHGVAVVVGAGVVALLALGGRAFLKSLNVG